MGIAEKEATYLWVCSCGTYLKAVARLCGSPQTHLVFCPVCGIERAIVGFPARCICILKKTREGWEEVSSVQ